MPSVTPVGSAVVSRTEGASALEVTIFRTINDLPNSWLTFVWLPMQSASFAAVPIATIAAYLSRRDRVLTLVQPNDGGLRGLRGQPGWEHSETGDIAPPGVPHWSPDGTLIITCGGAKDAITVLINPDTGHYRLISSPDPSLFITCPIMSPDTKRRLERAPDGLFEGEEAVLHVIERIVAPLGLRIDESSPWVDARLRTAVGCRPDF
jgi:hypothetical protein